MQEGYRSDTHKLVAIHGMIDFAEHLPAETLTLRNTEPVYPFTPAERLVNYVLHLAIANEWQNEEDEQAIDEITSILSQLDTGVDKPQEWQELFRANKALGEYLNRQ